MTKVTSVISHQIPDVPDWTGMRSMDPEAAENALTGTLSRPKRRKDPRGRERFAEYRRFDDAFNCSFREWLKARKTQWYDDMQNERLARTQ
jgi:hypothetical protein